MRASDDRVGSATANQADGGFQIGDRCAAGRGVDMSRPETGGRQCINRMKQDTAGHRER